MKKQNLSVKEFNVIVKNANVELNGIFKSPFVVINLLNKVANGTLSKIEGCEITPENIKKVAKELKQLHGKRYAFDINVLSRDFNGKICNEYASKKCPKFGIKLSNIDENGYHYTKEIPCTITGIFNAFARIVKVDISESNRQAKADARKAKADAKEKAKIEKARKAVHLAFGNDFADTLTDAQILEKYGILRKIK